MKTEMRRKLLRMAISEKIRTESLNDGRAYMKVRDYASRQYGLKNLSDLEISDNMFKKNGKMVLAV